MKIPTLLFFLLLSACPRAFSQAAGKVQIVRPDVIFHGARIITTDASFSSHQAMRIKEGRIAGLGTDAEILAGKEAQTRLVDLGGKTVLPGLIDSHVHPGAAMTEFDHPIPTMESIDDVLAYVRSRAEVLPEGEWIEIRQVFITRLREQRYPTRAELDAAAPNNPVLFATGPDASLNSAALRLSGIDRDFRVADGGPGYVEKDASNGELTGILRGCTRYVKVVPRKESKKPTEEDHLRRTIELFKDYNARGITAIADRNAEPDAIARYAKMRDSGELSVRLFVSASIANLGPIETIQERIRSVAGHSLRKGNTADSAMLRLIGIKTFLDGGMLTGSAYMREPWGVSKIYGITDPMYRGVLQIPRERLVPMVRTAMESGLQFTAHSVGDGAVHLLLDVYRELSREMPRQFRATRPCITHCNFMSAGAIDELAQLGAVADIQPIWLHLDAHTLEAQFGRDRLRYFQPLRSLFAAGAVVGGGSDHMQKIGAERAVNQYNPFLGIWIAISRRARGLEAPVHLEEALTREQALRFYTANNAHLLFVEKEIGSLEPGKLADFIVIDTDILKCPVDDIPKIKVLRTFLGGREVFARDTVN
ncbi:MAG: amidohydrolase [Verrucomicrobiales bacterium]